MRSIIVGFAGKIGSGKTTVSAAVAEALNWRYTSFGAYVREIAQQRGRGESRTTLQEIGASLVANPDELCRSVLAQVAWKPGMNVIMDGIRHAEIVDSLRRVTVPSAVYLIYIRIDDAERIRRQTAREIISNREISGYDSHTTEADAKSVLPSMADIVIDGSLPVSENIERVVSWLQDNSSSKRY